jgi:SAM-dependent methyltransferase
VPDAIFANARLAELHDVIEGERDDLSVYVAMMDELGALSVLDVGCGTGTFACRLARAGHDVVAVDPAVASLDIARSKPGAERVTWLAGDIAIVSRDGFDAVVMTGNVAQIFLTDDDWNQTLAAARSALLPRGHLVVETRDPSRQAWQSWNRAETYAHLDLDDGRSLETWVDVTDVAGPWVTFVWTFRFGVGDVLTSESTLRFRTRSEVELSLRDTGFDVSEVRDAPDRPGSEFVFVATPTP